MKNKSLVKRIIAICALLILLLILFVTARAWTSENRDNNGSSLVGTGLESEDVGNEDDETPAQGNPEAGEEKGEESSGDDSVEDVSNSDNEADKDSNKDGDNNKAEDVDIYDIEPETIINSSDIVDSWDYFQSYAIETGDKIFDRIYGRSYQDNPYIGLGDLRYLRILHYDYSHQIKLGEMIVNANIADSVLSIFKTLYDHEYEIESMRLIDDFWTGDGASSDDASIAANNTYAFCYRVISGGTYLSNHAYGHAIDVNPKQNPYYVIGSDGSYQDLYEWDYDYLDRTSGMAHMILKGDICESTFAAYGFSWGGDWSNPVDYQHFEW